MAEELNLPAGSGEIADLQSSNNRQDASKKCSNVMGSDSGNAAIGAAHQRPVDKQPPSAKSSESEDAEQQLMSTVTAPYVTCALYKFVVLRNVEQLRQPLLQQMFDNQVYGTLLLAEEGINGTIAGTQMAIDKVLAWLAGQPGLDGIDTKKSLHRDVPFYRAKVKLKREIVTMGVEGIDPQQSAGTYIEPEHWNALISDPDVLVVDTRNDYEVQIGSFEEAVDPQTTNFRDFPAWVENNLHPQQHKKVAMFCTGGIRCEKATAYLKQRGFEDVYHLRGGILNYLDKVPEAQSLWRGECFVFDNRVALDHDLKRGSYDQCHACRMPITEAEKELSAYLEGRGCHHCVGTRDSQQQERTAERQKQVSLAKSRGEAHIGDEAERHTQRRRREKRAYKKAQTGAQKT